MDLDRKPADPWAAAASSGGEFVAVGEGSTDVIPRLWAERILGELRSSHAATWRRLLGNASTTYRNRPGGLS